MSVYEKLYPYQQKIVDTCKSPATPLFMGIGTGKTITSLALFDKSKANKIFIICLVSKMNDWKEEIERHFPNLIITTLDKGTTKNLLLLQSDSDVFICSFESTWRLDKSLLKRINQEWFIIVDESHKIKNPRSKIGKFSKQLRRVTPYKCILTGSPQNNGYLDYLNQLHFVDLMPIKESDFKKRYCNYELAKFGGRYVNVLKGYKNTRELDDYLVENCIFYRRNVDEALLPTEIYAKLPSPKEYAKFKRTRVFGDIIADNFSSLSMGLRQMCSGFIKDTLLSKNPKEQWIKDLFDTYDKRIVIFYNFNVELQMLREICDKSDRPYGIYSGPIKDLTNFKNHENGVALCNYASAATGINDLVIGSVCVMYSPTTDYILFEQAKKRIDRLGQTEKPLLYYLKSTGTIEDAIYKALNEGRNFDDKLFENYLHEDNK